MTETLTRPRTLIDRVTDELTDRIKSGVYDQGMPSEAKLGEEYRISRETVRSVYKRLIVAGLVVSLPRKGYVVRKVEPIILRKDTYEHVQDHAASYDAGRPLDQWEQAVVAQGRTPTTVVDVRILATADVDPEVIRRLFGTAPDGQLASPATVKPHGHVILRDRVCYVDDIPYLIRSSYFPEHLAKGDGRLLLAPGDQVRPGGLLAAIGKPAANWYDATRARMATDDEQQRLQLPQITPGIDWYRTRMDDKGVVLGVMRSFLPGDRVILADQVSAR